MWISYESLAAHSLFLLKACVFEIDPEVFRTLEPQEFQNISRLLFYSSKADQAVTLN